MRAAVVTAYGPPEAVHLVEMDRPTPGPGEVLIRVHASTITAGDWRIRSLSVPAGFGLLVRIMFGLRKPRQPILGMELSGTIVGLGTGVAEWKVGDEVFGMTGFRGKGAHTEYTVLPASGRILPKPENFTHEEASAICFAGGTALFFLRSLANLKAGETVLINGGSGACGDAAIQIAKHLGAEVTAVTSTRNLDLVRSQGADHVIDYTSEDFRGNGRSYDVLFDGVGNTTYAGISGSLNPNGRYLVLVSGLPEMIGNRLGRKRHHHKVLTGDAKVTQEAMKELRSLCVSGAFKPHIDRTYPLEDIVEAHAYVATGRKRGSVVITM